MAKDKRLYMTFPNDFWMHPKVAPLTTEAKWSFVEMNGYSRMQDLDGAIPAVMAERLWKIEVLEELVTSHPERPLVVLTDGSYVIRDYDKHQQTTTDRESLSEVRAEAGRRGRAKQLADKPRANVGQVPGQIRAETETETETETTPKGVERPAKRGSRLSTEWLPSSASIAKAREDAPAVDHQAEHATFIDYWIAQPGQRGVKTDWDATWRNWMRRKQGDVKTRPTKQTPEERLMATLALAVDIDRKGIES